MFEIRTKPKLIIPIVLVRFIWAHFGLTFILLIVPVKIDYYRYPIKLLLREYVEIGLKDKWAETSHSLAGGITCICVVYVFVFAFRKCFLGQNRIEFAKGN